MPPINSRVRDLFRVVQQALATVLDSSEYILAPRYFNVLLDEAVDEQANPMVDILRTEYRKLYAMLHVKAIHYNFLYQSMLNLAAVLLMQAAGLTKAQATEAYSFLLSQCERAPSPPIKTLKVSLRAFFHRVIDGIESGQLPLQQSAVSAAAAPQPGFLYLSAEELELYAASTAASRAAAAANHAHFRETCRAIDAVAAEVVASIAAMQGDNDVPPLVPQNTNPKSAAAAAPAAAAAAPTGRPLQCAFCRPPVQSVIFCPTDRLSMCAAHVALTHAEGFQPRLCRLSECRHHLPAAEAAAADAQAPAAVALPAPAPAAVAVAAVAPSLNINDIFCGLGEPAFEAQRKSAKISAAKFRLRLRRAAGQPY
jgi:hypothetical protein